MINSADKKFPKLSLLKAFDVKPALSVGSFSENYSSLTSQGDSFRTALDLKSPSSYHFSALTFMKEFTSLNNWKIFFEETNVLTDHYSFIIYSDGNVSLFFPDKSPYSRDYMHFLLFVGFYFTYYDKYKDEQWFKDYHQDKPIVFSPFDHTDVYRNSLYFALGFSMTNNDIEHFRSNKSLNHLSLSVSKQWFDLRFSS